MATSPRSRATATSPSRNDTRTDTHDGLYIVMLSIHGLVRGTNIELGRDADTGGQVTYVVEQARALAAHPEVARVDLLTRQIQDHRVDPEYANAIEKLADRSYLVRVPCGPKRYLHKERLWPYLDGFVDAAIRYIKHVGHIPQIVHGHYADAGYVTAQLATLLGVPMVFTGHSLGRIKKQRLLEKQMRESVLEKKYNFTSRIEAEERALETAALVITSTNQEVVEQYQPYDHYQPERMVVIPPGVDLTRFSPFLEDEPLPPVAERVFKFLDQPDKPLIFAMARPDERKNFPTLLEAYAGNAALRERANLLLIAGNREDLRQLDPMPRRILGEIIYLVDKYDLYGSVAYPKHHAPEEVPDLYRLAAVSGGVFVNPALTEPFGLTLIEAAASGLPIVATHDGGPQDIIKTCSNGVLVDPLDPQAMGDSMLALIDDKRRWHQCSRGGAEGVHGNYTWSSHAERYVENVKKVLPLSAPEELPSPTNRSQLLTADRMIISDVDNTLTGSDDDSLRKLFALIEATSDGMAFAIATGREIGSAVEVLAEIGCPTPDILITSVGTEIYYRGDAIRDRSWQKQIDYAWYPEAVQEALEEVPGLYLQKPRHQRRFKLSYDYDPEKAPSFRDIRRHLRQRGLRVRPILSFEAYLDLIPIRASSGLAIRFLALKWGFSPNRLLVVGDSGNDEDMLRGETLGVVVGNYSPELEPLRGRPRIYFARGCNAAGVLEGIEQYNFTDRIKVPDEELVAEQESAAPESAEHEPAAGVSTEHDPPEQDPADPESGFPEPTERENLSEEKLV